MFFITLTLLFLLIASSFMSKIPSGRIAVFLITLTVLYLIFLPITYTPDKEYYIWWLNDEDFSANKEPVFQVIAAYIRANKLSYQFLHIAYLAIYCALLLHFISRFCKNAYTTAILYIPLVFLFFGTQLRFFLGYFAALLGFYYLFISKNRPLTIFFLTFAILSHYSLILFAPFYFLMRLEKKFFLRIIQIAFAVFIGYTFLTEVIARAMGGVRFIDYLKGDLVSSYLGGIFIFATIIPVYVLIKVYYESRIKYDPELVSDPKFTFLYKMSLIPLIFLGIALTVQVIGHRFIMTGMLLPILLFFYKLNRVRRMQVKFRYYALFIAVYILIFVHFNFSVGLVLGEWELVEEMQKMLNSNEIIKYLKKG